MWTGLSSPIFLDERTETRERCRLPPPKIVWVKTFPRGSRPRVVRATVLNSSTLLCTMPRHKQAELVSVEVTLNNDTSAHTLTSDGVTFDYFNGSTVLIDSIAPLGGPSGGGTIVTLYGSGYIDRGGTFCRFGATSR